MHTVSLRAYLLITNSLADLKNHPEPLVHLAIESGRHRIVECLIDAGADIDLADENNITPLNLATLKNDKTSMQALINASVSPNDGSLHDAARMVNADAVNLLLQSGHDANFPSLRHDGRPPLFELCLQAPAYFQQSPETAQQKEKQAKKAIQTLIQGGAFTNEQLPQAGNRSILIHALDSLNPYMMSKAFLECGQYNYINEDFNLFTDGKYTYSPTKYVEKGKCRGSNVQTQSLVRLLSSFNAVHRYWKNEGPQPDDMENPPLEIELAEKERKAVADRKRKEEEELRRKIEEQQREIDEQRRKIAMEQEIAQAKQKREDMIFRQRQAHDQAVHAANIAKENDRLKIQQAKDAQALSQKAAASRLRNDENEAEHRRKMKLINERKSLAQSELALGWAYNKGLEDASGSGSNRRALGPNPSRSNLDLSRRLRIEGSRITELD